MKQIMTDAIVIQNRIRKDLGDIPALANSIKENGLIEPIVLTDDQGSIRLIAGERRLTALKSLGIQVLQHAVHYVWRSELESNDPKKKLLAIAIEMEENVRRKDLSWTEQVLGKQKLLAIMQELHGLPIIGRPTTTEARSATGGFGVNKLSIMLGESNAQTSTDLDLAALITKFPILQKATSREDAKRQMELAIRVATGQQAPHIAQALHYKIMIDCDSEEQQRTLLTQFRSVGLKATPVVA